MLKAIDIHKSYLNPVSTEQKVHVLKGINVEFQKGEVSAIVGPSGAGKSTLLHVLGGLDRPTQGTVIFDRQDVYRLNDAKRAVMRNAHVGFIFQFYHLLPEFTALENVMLPALVKLNRGVTTQAKAQGMVLLDQVGMAGRAMHKPNELSGGEQQRIAIARALMNQPDVLLCDEPTGNLDSENGIEVIELLLSLNRANAQTLIIVTHDEEIARRSGRVIHLKDGEIKTPGHF